MAIKVVALDIYGTVLNADDHDSEYPPRRGLSQFIDECDRRGIAVVTSSDDYTNSVKMNLGVAFEVAGDKSLHLARFSGFFQLYGMKDFSVILEHFNITGDQLLVIGDNFDADIRGAREAGAKAIHCPKYCMAPDMRALLEEDYKEWDFTQINLDEF